jgi:DivIVA domain-containing protein
VPLERQSIEKKDFPIGRRGYDPDEVDAHLSAIADEIDELKRTSRRRTETLASAASEQVRAIVEAAESSAAEITRQAEEDAADIRSEASGEAQSTREQATDQARQYVGKVSESTAVMLQRLDAMESELSALIESLRTGSNRLNADLQLLEGNLGEVAEAAAPRPRFEPEPVAPISVVPEPEPVLEPEPEFEPVPLPPTDEAEYETEAEAGDFEEPRAAEPVVYVEEVDVEAVLGAESSVADVDDDTEGARLIALNMALNGTPRDETDRYLAENFELADRVGLLDEVYASVEG